VAFWGEFGRIVKEGMHFDYENKEKLQDLLLFPSSKTEPGKYVSLRNYVDRAPVGQKEIYFITGDNVGHLLNSPHLEVFKRKDFEVLLFADPIDEWVVQSLHEYSGKKLKAIDRGDLNLDSDDEKKEADKVRETAEKDYKSLLEQMKSTLAEQVKEVRFSARLTDSACCLVADEQGMNAHMERIMKAMGQEPPPLKRILELNPTHPILATMKAMHEKDQSDSRLADYSSLLLDQALLAEGSAIKDPHRFTRLVSQLMVAAK
jgi:molecular chaperone HtpG